jgi:hypothetical protein
MKIFILEQNILKIPIGEDKFLCILTEDIICKDLDSEKENKDGKSE